MQNKSEKFFFLSELIPSENVAINCLCSEYNTYYWQSIELTNSPQILHIT